MRKIAAGFLALISIVAFSQKPGSHKNESWKTDYRASATKTNDLVNTKLEVSFDFTKSWMYGKALLTLHPHFYSTDSLLLDAKGMAINEVAIIKSGKRIPLKYVYDSLIIRISLDKIYRGGENYTIFIDYIAKPDESKAKGSAAISGAKGLYFINPLGTDKNKPTQIWTQGETESNSNWLPTIDKPNQKTTQQISITVPGKYQTLSNGLLVSQKKNTNGTRTDTWKMDLPHAPYLIMMAVGEFSIIRDTYKGKEVSYYVEKDYASVARKIFGLTPEMIAYFSRITGIDYPWPKYAQIVCRDYVSGAMENTTATLHSESAQQNSRQLIDGNGWEGVIAHELFHQWFGDYVTTESWSNLTINESFADYSEYLWNEFKYGKDAAGRQNYSGLQNYLQSGSEKKDLVRFYYRDREEMFDGVSYQKGGCILNMLRNYVGDSAFFKSLNLFLKTKKFQAAEAQELRLAFEEVTGQDLNWFWNQWYYGSGHPKLDISYSYDSVGKVANVFIRQNQPDKVFKFLIAVDVYHGGEKKRHKVWIDQINDTLIFPCQAKPDLINVDADKILVCEKTDNKNLDDYIFQYTHAGLYADRREAIEYAASKQGDDNKALGLLKTALNDKYYNLRIYALQSLYVDNDSIKKALEPLLVDLANNDPKSIVRANAIKVIGKYKDIKYKSLFLKSVNDSSYSIAGNALLALGEIDSAVALNQAKILSGQQAKGALSDAIDELVFKYASENDFDALAMRFNSLPFGMAKFQILQPFANFISRVNNTVNFKKGIDMIVSFRDTIPEQYQDQVLPYINGMILGGIASIKQKEGKSEQADYVTSKLPQDETVPKYEIPEETLQKYTGEYELNGSVIKLILKENKVLTMVSTNGPDMELSPVSKDKFSIKYMNGLSVEFTINEKDEVAEMKLNSPGGQMIAPKLKKK
jgi:aminopeptidase N